MTTMTKIPKITIPLKERAMMKNLMKRDRLTIKTTTWISLKLMMSKKTMS